MAMYAPGVIGSQRQTKKVRRDALRNDEHPRMRVGQRCGDEPPSHRWRSVIERYVHRELCVYLPVFKGPVRSLRDIAAPQLGVLLYWPLSSDLQRYDRDGMFERWQLRL